MVIGVHKVLIIQRISTTIYLTLIAWHSSQKFGVVVVRQSKSVFVSLFQSGFVCTSIGINHHVKYAGSQMRKIISFPPNLINRISGKRYFYNRSVTPLMITIRAPAAGCTLEGLSRLCHQGNGREPSWAIVSLMHPQIKDRMTNANAIVCLVRRRRRRRRRRPWRPTPYTLKRRNNNYTTTSLRQIKRARNQPQRGTFWIMPQ